MSLLRKLEWQRQAGDMRCLAFSLVGHGSNAATNFVEVGIDASLIEAEVIPEVLRVDLKVIDDTRQSAAVCHKQVDVELAHVTGLGKLAADVLDDGFGCRRKELLQLVTRRYAAGAVGTGLAHDVKRDDERQVSQHAQTQQGRIVSSDAGHTVRNIARGCLDFLASGSKLLPLADRYHVEDIRADDDGRIVDVLDLVGVEVGHGDRLGLVDDSLQFISSGHVGGDRADVGQNGAAGVVDLRGCLTRLLLRRDGVENAVLENLSGLLGTECVTKIRAGLHYRRLRVLVFERGHGGLLGAGHAADYHLLGLHNLRLARLRVMNGDEVVHQRFRRA